MWFHKSEGASPKGREVIVGGGANLNKTELDPEDYEIYMNPKVL
jgi:hypothetical protein